MGFINKGTGMQRSINRKFSVLAAVTLLIAGLVTLFAAAAPQQAHAFDPCNFETTPDVDIPCQVETCPEAHENECFDDACGGCESEPPCDTATTNCETGEPWPPEYYCEELGLQEYCPAPPPDPVVETPAAPAPPAEEVVAAVVEDPVEEDVVEEEPVATSVSAEPEPSGGGVVVAGVAAQPTGELPFTGLGLGLAAGIGGFAMSGGAAMHLLAHGRRRRDTSDA